MQKSGAQTVESPTPIPKRKILVVDDERLVADSLVQILNLMGYDASCAYSGNEAVQRASGTVFDFLISDVVMEGLSGIDCAVEICKLIPACKVLLVSGNNRTSDLLKEAEERGHTFEILAKPIHPTIILDRLKAMTLPN
jgi:DNA-binding NtrC family response regulator